VRVAVAVVFVLAAGVALEAHALDEYLQATRVDIAPKGVALFVDLTPGVAVAQAIIGRLDSDGDGAFSPTEAETYGRALLSDLELSLDGSRLPLSLMRVEVPTAGEMREGQGTIRIKTWSDASLLPGSHRLVVRNAHMTVISVYLANALIPESPETRIVKQTRDTRQQLFELDFETGRAASTSRAQLGWLLMGVAVVTSLVVLRSSGNGGDKSHS
jgi:hypothetical protein